MDFRGAIGAAVVAAAAMTLAPTIKAASAGDTGYDSVTYCSGGSCTQVTTYYIVNHLGQWVIAGMTYYTYPVHTSVK